jgi:type IV protein arginine methyltransferase
MATQHTPESAQVLLLAAADHNLHVLPNLLRQHTPNVADPETLRTPLHNAIASLEKVEPQPPSAEKLKDAETTIRLLLENGAIWNTLDKEHETPGCIAYRLGYDHLYEMMVDAGVRCEMILNAIGGWEQIDSDAEEEGEAEGTVVVENDGDADDIPGLVSIDSSIASLKNTDKMDEDGVLVDAPKDDDKEESAEEKKSHPEDIAAEISNPDSTLSASEVLEYNATTETPSYLSSTLTFTPHSLLDSNRNAVMMDWESSVMDLTATLLLPEENTTNRTVLNVGFGMGIVDKAFEKGKPTRHIIAEAHPDVLKKLREDGWYDMPHVTILEGKWQDTLPVFMLENPDVTLGAIYFDTFGESYDQLKQFFTEYVVGLLDPQVGRFGFFHGLGADRRICYDVYTKVVEFDLLECGLDTNWVEVDLPELKTEKWEDVKRKYFNLDTYRLPVCTFGA